MQIKTNYVIQMLACLLTSAGCAVSTDSSSDSDAEDETLGQTSQALAAVQPGARRNINDLPAADRVRLASAIIDFIDRPILNEHINGHDWHHPEVGELFFSRHHTYLNKLENYLLSNGLAQFVPLPEWDPARPIPAEFLVADPLVSQARMNATPNRPSPAAFNDLCAFANASELAVATENWHDGVHGSVGGAMGSVSSAPGAPIFWLWHGFLDDLYHEYEWRCRDTSGWIPETMWGNFDGSAGDEMLVRDHRVGLGIKRLEAGTFRTLNLKRHGDVISGPNNTRWNLDMLHDWIPALGDFDGDGRDDILITNEFRIGILSYGASNELELKYAAPYGTSAGGWVLSASDLYQGAGNLSGTFRGADLMVTNDGRIGMLSFDGSKLTAVANQASGQVFGGWTYNAASDRIKGIADFDGDGKAELLIANNNFVGILKKDGASFKSLLVAQTGTTFGAGGWVFDALRDRYKAVANFSTSSTGEELLIGGSNGLGVLGYDATAKSFKTLSRVTTGSSIGNGWTFDALADRVKGAGVFTSSTGRYDWLMLNTTKLGAATRSAGGVSSLFSSDNGAWLGGWRLNTGEDRIVEYELSPGRPYLRRLPDFNNNRKSEFIITSGWGIATLEPSGGSISHTFIRQWDEAWWNN